MILYKSEILNNEFQINMGELKNNVPDVRFKTRNGSPFNIEKNYIPVKNTSNELVVCDDENIKTIVINFLANDRDVRILKGFSSLEVFGGSFHVSENVVRIAGNFNLNKYSKDVPILSLIVEGKTIFEDGTFPKLTMVFYYNPGEENEKDKIAIVSKPYLHDEVVAGTHIVNLTFFKKGVDTVYMVPSQKIISDLNTIDEVVARVGRKITPTLANNIILVEDLTEAQTVIKNQRLKEGQIITICDSFKRADLFY